MMTRNGATIPELLAAGVVVGVLVTVTLQYTSAAAAQRKAAQQRGLAVEEAGNILETLSSWTYDQLSDERAGQLTLSKSALDVLPQAQLRVNVSQTQTEQPAKRILVEITWRGRGGQSPAPVRTATWRYDVQTH